MTAALISAAFTLIPILWGAWGDSKASDWSPKRTSKKGSAWALKRRKA